MTNAIIVLSSWLAFTASNAMAATATSQPQRQWYTLAIDGERTGYAYEERVESSRGTIEREVFVFDVRQLQHRSRIERRIELTRNEIGIPLTIAYEGNAGTVHNAWQGSIESGQIRLRPKHRHSTPDAFIVLQPDTEFSLDRSHILAPLWQAQASSLTYRIFDPARQRSVAAYAEVIADPPAESQTQVHVRITRGSPNDNTHEDIWFDRAGELHRLETQSFGNTLVWTPCHVDCDRRVTRPVDLMERLVVRSPVRIPANFMARTIRYVITLADGTRPELRSTSEQRVAFDNANAVVTVCADCGITEHPSAEELDHYRAPNAWVRSDDAEIRRLALSTASPFSSIDYRMRKLVQMVRRSMHGKVDFLGYADAIQALHSGSGDCTEFAVLLAAFARAQGIPARIVVGLVYSDRFSGKKDVFSPHSWVQVWNGEKWKSYDAALDGFDSTHIALAFGNGAPGDVNREFTQLPRMRIEKIGAVHKP